MKELKRRWNAPTPRFWKKVQKQGMAIAIVGGVIIKFNPAIGGIVTAVGSTISTLAQLAEEK